MIQTNNYEFNIVEGNDIVNPLVQLNPNFTKLDTILKAIADSGIGTALQVKSGINHAITKDDDCSVFKFIATADYRTGDTFSLNGDTVTMRCMDGTVPKDRAFVINQSVMCAINGTLLTLIGGSGTVDAADVSYSNSESGLTATNVQGAIDELKQEVEDIPVVDNASDVNYDNTASGLTANNVQSAIDELCEMSGGSSVSVIADGEKTYRTLFVELSELVDFSKITRNSILQIGTVMFTLRSTAAAAATYTMITVGGNNARINQILIGATPEYNGCNYASNAWQMINSVTSQPTAGTVIELFY